MKVLVASEGTSIDSPVARRLTLTATYMVVDLDTLRIHIVPGEQLKDHRAIVGVAQEWGVEAVIVGGIAPRFQELLGAAKLRGAIAGTIKVREALERLKNGQLRLMDLSHFQKSVEEHEALARTRRVLAGRLRRNGGNGSGNSARGRHHLQQYGGRGH